MFKAKFGAKLAEGLAGQWAAQQLSPALVFWAGGIIAWLSHNKWKLPEICLQNIDNSLVYIVLAMGGILLIAISGTVMQWLQTPVIRLAEGYWPLRFCLARQLKKGLNSKEEQWEKLDSRENRTAEEQAELVRLDMTLSRYPLDKRLLMPTTLGNLLRSAEEYPRVRYGLDTIVCWPRLWLLMPDETLEVLSEAREELNSCARLMLWSIFFLIWILWTDWAVLSLLIFPIAYMRMLKAADTYGELIRAAFDLHRFKLYESLKWPLPPGPKEEKERGEQLTEYLSRGTGADSIRFREENP
ncbi:MAG: hypothetical protein DRI57_03775 [Deltaproteobacteria bacterium]|nr:MAG: hypothetical protein DRI57_03775 [Deltaproteobacteria bacterium]